MWDNVLIHIIKEIGNILKIVEIRRKILISIEILIMRIIIRKLFLSNLPLALQLSKFEFLFYSVVLTPYPNYVICKFHKIFVVFSNFLFETIFFFTKINIIV